MLIGLIYVQKTKHFDFAENYILLRGAQFLMFHQYIYSQNIKNLIWIYVCTLNLVSGMLVVCYKSIAPDSERYTMELHFEKWLIRLPSFFNSRFIMVNTLAEFIKLILNLCGFVSIKYVNYRGFSPYATFGTWKKSHYPKIALAKSLANGRTDNIKSP